jgi:cytochrome c biogenesis protein CcdA
VTNKKRSFGEHLEALFIVIPGGVGLFIVARTLRAYWDRDWVASAIVCAMGAALLFGLLELLLRQRRASLLHRPRPTRRRSTRPAPCSRRCCARVSSRRRYPA